MDTVVESYNLKDYSIIDSEKDNDSIIWTPDDTYVVLGRSNNPVKALNLEEVNEDNVKVLKRPSGGETVILSPKTIVIGVKIKLENGLNAHQYFKVINDKIMSTLGEFGVKDTYMKGISDISIKNKKILGSSIYKKKDIVFYHAVLNVNESIGLISRYLKYPSKEPDYRKGRNHEEFVTSLSLEGYDINLLDFKESLSKNLS